MDIFNKLLNYKINNTIFNLRPPDLTDERPGKTLMVWNKLAYWNIIDDDLKIFLMSFDGKNTLTEIVNSNQEWKNHYKTIIQCVKTFIDKGVLYSSKKTIKENQPKYKIENITVNITNKCNLNCLHCYYTENLNNNISEVSGHEIALFLKSIRKHCASKPSLFLLGGEPLIVQEKLEPILFESMKLGFKTNISTNGTLINANFIKLAKKHKFSVQVSLDGHDPETNDFIRGNDTFNKTIENIKLLVNNKINTILCMTCHKGNINFIEKYYELAKKLQVNEVRIIPLKLIGNAKIKNLIPSTVSEILKKCSSIFIKNNEYQKFSQTDTLSILLNTCYYSEKRLSCGSGTQTLLIDADGSIYPCLNINFDFLKIGNIKDPNFSFDHDWKNSNKLIDFRHNISVDNKLSECYNCNINNWCLGGCHGETYKLKKSLLPKPYNCQDLKQSIIDSFWLISDFPVLLNTQKG